MNPASIRFNRPIPTRSTAIVPTKFCHVLRLCYQRGIDGSDSRFRSARVRRHHGSRRRSVHVSRLDNHFRAGQKEYLLDQARHPGQRSTVTRPLIRSSYAEST